MAKRTGLPTMQKLAKKTCQLYVKFAPIITAIYGTSNPALVTAVQAVNTACAELVLEIDGITEIEVQD